MDLNTLIVLVLVLVLLIVAVVVWNRSQKRQSEKLKNKFGPEYEHAVETYGDPKRAEDALKAREARVRKLDIQPLAPDLLGRFSQAWRQVQAEFVDDPSRAVQDADRLVNDVMQARGYPMADFAQRAEDISVDHPDVVTNYRTARDIAMANRQGHATTEDLRKALVCYRSLFQDLLQAPELAPERKV